MSIDFEKLRLKHESFINNQSTRLPICMCIDSSMSMASRMGKINDGIKSFIDDIKKDIYAVDPVELCIITFGGTEAKILLDYSNVNDIVFSDIVTEGLTPLGAAAEFAYTNLKERLDFYNKNGIQHYKPWIIFISDGVSTDEYKSIARKIAKEEKENRIKVLCIGVGDKPNSLKEFTHNQKVSHLSDLKVNEFFSWLSKSMSSKSQSQAEDDSELPTDSWENYLI